MTAFAVLPETTQAAVQAALGTRIKRISTDLGEVSVVVAAADYLEAATLLRDHAECKFEQMMDLCGVDYVDYKDGAYDGPRNSMVTGW